MRPVATMLDQAGAGCAAFPSDLVRNADPAAVQAAIEADIGETVELVGMRHVDLDGRDVDHPITHGLTLIGFQLSPCLNPQLTSPESRPQWPTRPDS